MSKFSYFRSPVWNKTPDREVTLDDVCRYLRSGRAAEATRRLRSFTDPKAARDYKSKAFDYVTFSGVFSRCCDKSLLSHSQLLCLDFDHVGDVAALKRSLLADRQLSTRLLFTSPSGDGVKWVVDIDTSRCSHRQWFLAIRNYLYLCRGLEVDEKCANESRGCFLPYDPEAVVL